MKKVLKSVDKCSRCGKPLMRYSVGVGLKMSAFRLKEGGNWEEMPNFNVKSQEIICDDCFEKLIRALDEWRKTR